MASDDFELRDGARRVTPEAAMRVAMRACERVDEGIHAMRREALEHTGAVEAQLGSLVVALDRIAIALEQLAFPRRQR